MYKVQSRTEVKAATMPDPLHNYSTNTSAITRAVPVLYLDARYQILPRSSLSGANYLSVSTLDARYVTLKLLNQNSNILNGLYPQL